MGWSCSNFKVWQRLPHKNTQIVLKRFCANDKVQDSQVVRNLLLVDFLALQSPTTCHSAANHLTKSVSCPEFKNCNSCAFTIIKCPRKHKKSTWTSCWTLPIVEVWKQQVYNPHHKLHSSYVHSSCVCEMSVLDLLRNHELYWIDLVLKDAVGQ